MRVVFICGSLESGRDGVGDYTRRLACELIRQGNEVRIIALNDKQVATASSSIQSEENTEVEVIRFSFLQSWNSRLCKAENFINAFQPHWISLQYVPFAFHSRGLPFGFATKLKRIANGVKWHIMFHELWVGMDTKASLQYKIWGWLQRKLIRSLVKKIKPSIIHTQTKLYQNQLKKDKINANYLPLFGNIPSNKIWYKKKEQNKLSFVVFGTIHSGSPIEDFAEEAALYAKQYNCKISITFIGKNGTELKNWIKELEKREFCIISLGEQNSEIISHVFHQSDYGIATTPLSLLEKSGSVAAMLEHGLPIVVVSRNWEPRGHFIISKYNNFQYKKGDIENVLNQSQSVFNIITLQSVAFHFLKDLQNGSRVLSVEKPREAKI